MFIINAHNTSTTHIANGGNGKKYSERHGREETFLEKACPDIPVLFRFDRPFPERPVPPVGAGRVFPDLRVSGGGDDEEY
jgi:hypothetical protein